MVGCFVRCQYYLLLVLLFLVLPLTLLYFGYRGVMYWVDVWGRPEAQKKTTLHLDEIGDVLVFYPKSTQLNGPGAGQIELEFAPLQPPGQGERVVVTFEESSDHIRLVPEAVELALSAPQASAPTIDVETRDLDRPPAGVDVVVTAMEPESGVVEQATLRLTIDNTLWRIAAAFAVVSGAVTFLGAALALLKLR